MIEKIKKYLLWEKECMKSAEEIIVDRNRKMLVMLQSSMIASYVGLLIFGLIKNGYSSFQALFAFMLVYMIICLVMLLKSPSMSVGILTYGVYIVTILLCLYAAAFVDPDHINSLAYICFLLFPILYIDSSVKLDVLNLVLAGIYLYNVLEYKVGKALMLEAINIVSFSLLGLVIGHFVRWRNLRGLSIMEKYEKSELQEALTGLPNHNCLLKDLASMPMSPQAVLSVEIAELSNPIQSFGLHFRDEQLQKLGRELLQAAEEQGIHLYCCGGELIGIVDPRMLEGLFQRLEPLHHILRSFVFHKKEGEAGKLHFGIGASLCEGDVDMAFARAAAACSHAKKEGMSRIVIYEEECEEFSSR